jgi:hypothetical protein
VHIIIIGCKHVVFFVVEVSELVSIYICTVTLKGRIERTKKNLPLSQSKKGSVRKIGLTWKGQKDGILLLEIRSNLGM